VTIAFEARVKTMPPVLLFATRICTTAMKAHIGLQNLSVVKSLFRVGKDADIDLIKHSASATKSMKSSSEFHAANLAHISH